MEAVTNIKSPLKEEPPHPVTSESVPETSLTRAWRHLRRALPTIAYSGMTAVAGLISGVLLARQLGPTVRGEVAAVIAWAGVLAIGGDLGIGIAASYFIAKHPGRVGLLWTQALAFATVLGGALACFAAVALPSHLHLERIHRGVAILAFSAIPLMMAAANQGYLLLGAGCLPEMNRVRFVAILAYAGGIVVLTLLEVHEADSYVFVFWCAQLISCALATYYCRGRLGARFRFGTEGLKEVLPFGAKTQLGSFLGQANLRLDQLLISLWLDPAALGFYVVAVALGSLPALLFGALSLVAIPAILQAPDRPQGASRACRHLGFAVLAAAPISIGGIFAARYLLELFFGSQFVPALTMAQILFAASLFQGVNQLSGLALRALGTPGRVAISEAIGVVITIVLLAVLIPMKGALGAAITSLAAYAAVCLLQVSMLAATARVRTPIRLSDV
jgi:O-antigen/teichoic acid export membrane protein